ncbi:FAD-dependent oxidoreductase [Pararhodobacter oceanensis]|uniref:FAD-dependent oxidoreductase n=1 Tax=Pararhodobacter oceanensis TaxID=2172121 RepID=UPI003A900222
MSERQTAVISGAGPVGLSLALQLARAGVGVTVLEMRSDVNLTSKASTFHASTLDLLQTLGVLDPMMAQGIRVDHVQYREASGRVIARMGFETLADETRNPFRLHCEQAVLSVMLRDLLAKEDAADIRFCSAVETVQETEGKVVVGYRDLNTQALHDIHADYLFGCDGALSAVREACRIGYVEKPYPGMVVRLYADPNLSDILPGIDGITYVFDGDDSVSLLQMHDCWRVIVRVPTGVSAEQAKSDEWLTQRVGNLLPIEKILPRVKQRDAYDARRRMTLQSRTERVFLAGDALHLTNTRGGMNLNAGIHDAFALAQATIAAVADDSLAPLQRSADERFRVIKGKLLPRTDQNIRTGRERLSHIVALSKNAQDLRAYLRSQAMLDMLDGVAMPAINGAQHAEP